MNIRMIRYIVGSVMQMEALFFLLPALTAVIYKEKMLWVFLLSSVFCLLSGMLVRGKKPENTTIYSTEGYVSVALCWIVMSICGAVPLYFSGFFPNPVDALFEIVSGFTTTGATILSDVEILPRSVLMWRSFSHWIGGMGVLVFILAVLPMAGASSMHLMKAESPGPSVGKLYPKVKNTAKILYTIYLGLTLTQMVLMMIVGCPVFDSINLSFATAGTGGFGVLNSGCADYNTATQIVLTVFMILFGVNFNVYFLILIGNIKDALKCEEVRAYLLIIASVITMITLNTMSMFANVGEAFQQVAFQVASIITTTGFSTTDFNLWPEFSKYIMVLIMFIGACAGSTGGGMKVSRIVIMVKTVIKELVFIRHPRNVRKVRFEGKQVEHEVLRNINVFLIAYLIIYAVSVLLISFDNFDGVTNFTAVAATFNNIGPGLAGVGPMSNFGAFSNFSKIILIFDMLAGRLEIFPMLILCSMFMKKKRWN